VRIGNQGGAADGGKVARRLKTAWRDGATPGVMLPLEFMQFPAARATEGRPLGTRAPAPAAPDPPAWGDGTQAKLRAGGTKGVGQVGRRIGLQ